MEVRKWKKKIESGSKKVIIESDIEDKIKNLYILNQCQFLSWTLQEPSVSVEEKRNTLAMASYSSVEQVLSLDNLQVVTSFVGCIWMGSTERNKTERDWVVQVVRSNNLQKILAIFFGHPWKSLLDLGWTKNNLALTLFHIQSKGYAYLKYFPQCF